MATAQLSLFEARPPAQRVSDREREELAKEHGMKVAAEKAKRQLKIARDAAVAVAMDGDGTADIERVRAFLEDLKFDMDYGSWAGNIFRGKQWEPTGAWIRTTHRDGHQRAVRVWRLVR